MSIINEALKKARRGGDPASELSASPEDQVIRPRQRSSKPSGFQSALPTMLLLLVFLGLVGGLGYFLFQEYYAGGQENTSSEQTAQSESGDSERANGTGGNGTGETAAPAESRDGETSPAAKPSPSPTEMAPAAIAEFKINGVMRSGDSARVITNSGVYREGDVVSAPAGYTVEEIGQEQLILRSPEGESWPVRLP